MKSVDVNKYDKEYFTKSIGTTLDNYINSNHEIFNILINIFSPSENYRIVDFGCGSGLFSLLLNKTYKCEVIGIDYSPQAIALCNEYKNRTGQDKLSFLHSNIKDLPQIEGVNAVYFADVIEHLYDDEINLLLEKIKSWKLGNEDQYLIIHTDNLLFLKYIRWMIDLFALLTFTSSFSKIKARNLFENERHVNLMTLKTLSKKLKSHGFNLYKTVYPSMDESRLQSQLGAMTKIPFFSFLIKKLYPWIKTLSPSFYAVYKQ